MWEYRARVVKWVDGDTLDVIADLGFRVHMDLRLRLISSTVGIQCAEMHDKDPARRALALRALDYSATMAPVNSRVTIRTKKEKAEVTFDRYLAEVITSKNDNVGNMLLALNLAVPYHRG